MNKDISDGEVCFKGFRTFRFDRSVNTSVKTRGGGVIIAVRNVLLATQIIISDTIVEQLFVQVKQGPASYIIGGIYIPPNSSMEVYQTHCHTVEEICQQHQNAKLVIFGDYNLPNMKWQNENMGLQVSGPDTSPAGFLAECFAFLNLFQVNNIPNNRNVYLDLVFSHISNVKVALATDLLIPNNFHHVAYQFELYIREQFDNLKLQEWYYDFKNADYYNINYYLGSVNWEEALNSDNLEYNAEKFYEILNYGISLFVPLKHSSYSKFPNWFSPELKNKIIEKKRVHKQYMATNSFCLYRKFCNLRARCKELREMCYTNYIHNIEHNISVNPRQFWKFVNDNRRAYSFPSTMYLGEKSADNGQDMANLFAEHFSRVYSNNDQFSVDLLNTSQYNIKCNNIAVSEVFEKINKLPNTLRYGPDGVPNFLIKQCMYSLSKPLAILFNSSLDTGVFPLLWKNSYVIPIFKTGEKENIENYRCVCNQSAIPKLLDSLVYAQLSWQCRNIIISQQHGFSNGKSTVSNLVLYETEILSALENRSQVDAIYTDFSKAFDRVNFDLLLIKLDHIGFNKQLLLWLESFLKGRKQKVRIGNFFSQDIEITSGVPQGSHCAPLIFNLFVNDIFCVFNNCKFLMFADDLKIYKIINSIDDIRCLQGELDKLVKWSEDNLLNLNISKCCSISFYRGNKKFITQYQINNSTLSCVTFVKDLGVTLTEDFRFNVHISNITSRAFKLIGFISRNCKDLSVNTSRLIYCTLIRSILEYASIVWSPYQGIYIDAIERVQNKFLRICAFKLNYTIENHDYQVIRNQLGLKCLTDRRQMFDLCYIYNIIHGSVSCPELLQIIQLHIPPRALRNNELFHIPFHLNDYSINAPINRALKSLNNKSQIDVFHSSFPAFKRLVLNL